MKIELHLIQSFGPSCLNRDSTNSPKDCDFGGVRRARVSSQCFKRAMRTHFRAENSVPVGERTKRLQERIVPLLAHLEPNELVPHGIDAFLETYYSKTDSKKSEQSAVLLFLSQPEMDAVAAALEETWPELQKVAAERAKKVADIKAAQEKKKAKATGDEAESATEADGKFTGLPKPKEDKAVVKRLQEAALSADIALFGRMLAEHTEHKIEGSCQVAHAISTHAVAQELDFFSAVDDLNKDDSGAGMLGDTGFNAACYYRYALLDVDALRTNLKGDAEATNKTVAAFVDAFVKALPSGKQNSMAAQSLPSLGLFVVRESGAPCSLVNAFCTPVRPSKTEGLLDASVGQLAQYWARYLKVYGADGIVSTAVFCLDGANHLGALSAADKGSVPAAIKATLEPLGTLATI